MTSPWTLFAMPDETASASHLGTPDATSAIGYDVEHLISPTEKSTASPRPTDPCMLVDFFFKGILMFLLVIFGLTGNCLSTYTLWPNRNRTATSFILICLAAFDQVFLLVVAVMVASDTTCKVFNTCTYYLNFYRQIVGAVLWNIWSICHMAGTFIVVLVTFHRYIAVCHHTKVTRWGSMKAAKRQVLAIFLFSIAFTSPRFFDDYPYMLPDGSKVVVMRTSLGNSRWFTVFYNVALYYLVIFLIPFTALIYMTVRLLQDLKATKKKREEMTRAKKDGDDLTMTLVAVVIIFLVCQIINPIRRATLDFIPASRQGCGSVPALFNILTNIFVTLNSAVNFVVYCFFGRRFRKMFITRVLHRGRVAPGETMTMTANTLHPTDRNTVPIHPNESHQSK